jgi:peptide/nickel transport system substrate-binding protein
MNGADSRVGGRVLTRFSRRELIHTIAATGMVFAAPPSWAAKQAPPAGKLSPIVIGKRVDDIESFDPHESVSSSAAEIIGNLYQTLVVWNPATKKVEPDLGLAASYTSSADGLTWTFVLKSGRLFASGNRVTAEDVVFSLERIFEINGAAATILGPLGLTVGEGNTPFKVVDGNVTITLSPDAPNRLLLPCLTASVCSVIDKRLLTAHYVENPPGPEAVAGTPAVGATPTLHDSGRAWLRLNSAGSGPFKIAEIVVRNAPERPEDIDKRQPVPRNDEIILEANANYPGYSVRTRPVVVRSIADPVKQKKQLDDNEVQVAWNLEFPGGVNDKSLVTTSAPAANLLLLCMNVGDTAAHLDCEDVRRAIRCAIDVQKLATDLKSQRWSPQHEFCPSVLRKGSSAPLFSQDEARRLLTKAGIKTRLELTIDHMSGNPRSHAATLLADQLDAVGFGIKLRPSTGRVFLDRLNKRQYQLALLTWDADYPDPQSNAHAFCVNSQTENRKDVSQDRTMAWFCRWFDDEVVAAAKAAAAETDEALRRTEYDNIQNKLLEKGPYAFLLEETRIVATQKKGPKLTVGMIDSLTRYPIQTN